MILNLKGKSVLITRAIHQSKNFIELVKKHGGTPITLPLIEIKEVEDKTEIDSAFEKLDEIDWIVFTSENAVEYFFNYAHQKGIKFYFYPDLKIATVGEKTKLKLEQLGYRTNFVPIKYTAEVLAENMDEDISDKKILIPRSDLASNDYLKVFEKRGAQVIPLVVYTNEPIEYDKQMLLEKFGENLDYLTFTSGSTVQSFYRTILTAGFEIKNYKLYCIGTSTAKAAKNLGFKVDAIADPHTEEALFDLILKDNSHV